MFPLTLFQTLEKRGLIATINDRGPFKCTWKNSWLGDGYYFWDGHIDLAHWWGKVHRNGEYFIASGEAIYGTSCWDLHGRSDLREEFRSLVLLLDEEGVMNSSKDVVLTYIKYLQSKPFFKDRKYDSIRVLGSNSVSIKSITTGSVWQVFYESQIKWKSKPKPGNFQFIQPVQVCLFEKTSLGFKNFRVIFDGENNDMDLQVF